MLTIEYGQILPPSPADIAKQASQQAPPSKTFFESVASFVKMFTPEEPIKIKVGKYRATVGEKKEVPRMPEITPEEKPFIQKYMPYILIGGVGLVALIIFLRRS